MLDDVAKQAFGYLDGIKSATVHTIRSGTVMLAGGSGARIATRPH
jgi:hypothetical protein